MKYKFLILIFMILFSLTFVSAYQTNCLTSAYTTIPPYGYNCLTNQTITFTSNQNVTMYLQVPQNTFLTTGYFNVSGFKSSNFPSNSIINYFKLDEGSGTTAFDSLGVYNQTLVSTSLWASGKINTGLKFNGTTNTVTGSKTLTQTGNAFTVNFWANSSIASGGCGTNYGTFIGNDNTGNPVTGQFHVDCSNVENGIWLTTDSASSYINPAIPINNTMQMYTMVIVNGTPVKYYQNGVNVKNASSNSYFNGFTGANNFYLDKNVDAGTPNITIDEVGLWNRSLTSAEISSLYNSGTGIQYALNNPINDTSLYIGNNTFDLNVSTIGSQPINITTADLSSAINSYTPSCTYYGGNCFIPFIFQSAASGSFSYYAVNFNDLGFIDNGVTYSSPVISGQSSNIIGNFSIGQTPTNIILTYNNTNSTPSVTVNGFNYILTSNVVAPVVGINSNISFYYTFLINGTYYTSNSRNQTVNNVAISSSCGGGTFPFINITNFDEETLNKINGTVEYNLGLNNNNLLISGSNGSSIGINFQLCSNINLTSSYSTYNLQLRYYDNASLYFVKTYNIQNSPTTNLPFNLNLYYLNKTLGTSFKIVYNDYYYNSHPGALVQIERQYLNTNTYNTVEIPIIGSNGFAYGSFDTSNVRYKVIIIDQGNVIDTFNDVFPVCQNAVLGQCELDLHGSQNQQNTVGNDFTYNIVKTNNSLILTFTIPSGTPRTITFITEQDSRYLSNITNCNTALFSSGGSITCGYNQTVGDSIINIQILNSGGSPIYESIQISQDLSSFFMLNNFFIAFVLLLALGLMFISSGVMMVIVGVVGIMYMGLIFLLKGSDITSVAGSLGWIVVASILVIYKISQREEHT